MFEIDLTIWSVSDSAGAIISYAALIRDITHEMQLEQPVAPGAADGGYRYSGRGHSP